MPMALLVSIWPFKFGPKEEFVLDLNPSDMAFSRLEIVLGINRFLINNNLNYRKFISPVDPVIVKRRNGDGLEPAVDKTTVKRNSANSFSKINYDSPFYNSK